MKKQLWIIMLVVVMCLALVLTACQPEAHVCQSKCPTCGKCTNQDCKDPACADKCQGHTTQHVCESKCPVCGKCTNMECTDPVCAEKCEGHEDVVLVNKIIVSTDDENNDGTIGSPLEVVIPQGQSTAVSYAVQPNNATNKQFQWTAGSIADGAFTPAEASEITIEDNGFMVTFTASATATDTIIEGKAKDGSGVTVYIALKVEVYTAVTAIKSSTLAESENEEYDYELVTAQYTNWDINGGILPRGQELLDGAIFGGKQAPRNLTYFGNLYNFGIVVEPSDATDKDVTISYSEEGIVSVDAAGALTVQNAGETIVTVASYADPDVKMTVKVTVLPSLYRGILKSAYDEAPLAANTATGWDLDADHAQPAQDSRYDDWHLVMVHSNLGRGQSGIDNNQKIFYMGAADRPYGISVENNVGSKSGGSLLESAGMMWAKVAIPESAITFNVRIGNNDKTHGQYRVVFVAEDGTVTNLSNDWMSFPGPISDTTQKFVLPDEIKGQTGAVVIEHRVTEADNNAELQVKLMKFEGQVDVESVQFEVSEKTYNQGAREFTIRAFVNPSNATNDKVTYAMAVESEGKGVEVDENGKVLVNAEALGVYHIIASSVADPTKTATFTLTITIEEIEVNAWNNKTEILEGVSDVKWEVIGKYDAGVGEGVDLSCTNFGGSAWSAISLKNRTIKSSSFILTFGARVFHRDGETYPHFKVKVIDGETETWIKGIGLEEDYFYVDTDETQYASYDLSAFIGKTVEIQIGIDVGSHAVIQNVKFTGSETSVTSWADKKALLDVEGDAWTVEGTWNQGAGEGIDLQSAGSFVSNKFVIGAYNAQLTVGLRIFKGQEGDKGNPEVKLLIIEGENQTVVRATGVDKDTVTVDTEGQTATYDLSQFIGKEVEIRIVCEKEVHHCVVQSIAMAALA